MLSQQGPGHKPISNFQALSDQLQGASIPGLPGSLALHHFLLKTATGFSPPNQNLPLFTLAPQDWDFFGPGSPFLFRSMKNGCEKGDGQALCLSPLGYLWVSCATSLGTALALMCPSPTSVHAYPFLCQLTFVLGGERRPKGFALRPRAEREINGICNKSGSKVVT